MFEGQDSVLSSSIFTPLGDLMQSSSFKSIYMSTTLKFFLHPQPNSILTHISNCLLTIWASLVAQSVKNLPAMQETQVRSLGQKDLPKKETVTHSSSLDWRIPWREKPGQLQSRVLQRVRHDWVTNTHTHDLQGNVLQVAQTQRAQSQSSFQTCST